MDKSPGRHGSEKSHNWNSKKKKKKRKKKKKETNKNVRWHTMPLSSLAITNICIIEFPEGGEKGS